MDQLMQSSYSAAMNLAHNAVPLKRETQPDETQAQPDVGFVDVDSDRVGPLELPRASGRDVDPLMLPRTFEDQDLVGQDLPNLPEPRHFKQEALDDVKEEPPETLLRPTTSCRTLNINQDVGPLQLSSLSESQSLKQEVEFHVKEEPPGSQSCLVEAGEVRHAELQPDTGLLSSSKRRTSAGTSVEERGCTECHEVFTSTDYLFDHVKKHGAQRAWDCDRNDKQSISRKHQPVCSETEAYACDMCDASFPRNYEFTLHKRCHSGEKSYICDICEGVDPTVSPRIFQTWNTESQNLPEPHPFEQVLLDDIKQEPPEMHLCPTTSHGKQTFDQGVVYTSKCHTSLNTSVDEHGCIECDELFTSPDHLVDHTKKHGTQNKPDCDQSIGRQHLLACSETKVYACDSCEAKFSTNQDLKIHRKSHSSVKRYTCDLCNAKFARKSHLAAHKRSHSGSKPGTHEVSEIRFVRKSRSTIRKGSAHVGIKRYACDICESTFTIISSLNKHKKIHSGVKPHVCDVCEARFTERYNLTNHKRIHTGETPYVCDICDAKFTQCSNLITHKKHHSGLKPHVCDVCGAKFTENSYLTQHKKIHLAVKPYACDICEKRFTKKSYLTQHEKIHSAEKPFACGTCEARFCLSATLANHMRVHSGPEPYTCGICEAKFAHSSSLAKHKLNHPGVKAYTCDMCEAKFAHSSSLAKHKVKHSGEKPYACDTCEARFSHTFSLTNHKVPRSGVKPHACGICKAGLLNVVTLPPT